MASYDEIKAMMRKMVPLGWCQSFPVPVMRDGKLYDSAFLFTVDRATRVPNEPCGVVFVDAEAETATEAKPAGFFDGVAFRASPFRMPERYEELSEVVKGLYPEVRSAIEKNSKTEAVDEYAATVLALTQECLKPYYRALAPALFDDGQEDQKGEEGGDR